MNLKATDLDAIFGGANAVLNTSQNVCNAFTNGINDVRNAIDNSRRNQPFPNQQQMTYAQPVSYDYGYADYNGYNNMGYNSLGYNSLGYNNPMMSQQVPSGYVGFTNPAYGMNGSGIPSGGAWG